MVSFIMLHAQLYFLFVFDFPEMVAPYLKCIFVWGSIKFLFLFLFLINPSSVSKQCSTVPVASMAVNKKILTTAFYAFSTALSRFFCC